MRQIPSVPAGIEPKLRNFLSAVREAINGGGVGTGGGATTKTIVISSQAQNNAQLSLPVQPGAVPDPLNEDPAYEQPNLPENFWGSVAWLNESIATLTYTGLTFKPNDPTTNKITWTACIATRNGTDSWSVAAETSGVLWTTGVLYIYYVPGNLFLSTTTSLVGAIAAGGRILASYRGGTDLTADSGRAYIDGDTIIAGTVGANQLVTSTAVITAGAQIANLIVDTLHVKGNAITENVFYASGTVTLTQPGSTTGAIATTTVIPSGTISIPAVNALTKRVMIVTLQIVYYDSSTGWIVLTAPGGAPFDSSKSFEPAQRLQDSSNTRDTFTTIFATTVAANDTSLAGDFTVSLYNGNTSGKVWNAATDPYVNIEVIILTGKDDV